MSARMFDEIGTDTFFYLEEFKDESTEEGPKKYINYEGAKDDYYNVDIGEEYCDDCYDYYDELLEYHDSYFDDYHDY